jgi:hypothetical protein
MNNWQGTYSKTVDEACAKVLDRLQPMEYEFSEIDERGKAFPDGFLATHILWAVTGSGLTVSLFARDCADRIIVQTIREIDSPRYVPPARLLEVAVAPEFRNGTWRLWVSYQNKAWLFNDARA